MSTLFIVAVFAATLFLVRYFSSRRFGLSALGLGAGYLISASCTGGITLLLEQAGVTLTTPPLSSLVAIVLILLPGSVLLLKGAKSKDVFMRIAASLGFTVLALALMLEPLGTALLLNDDEKTVFNVLAQWQNAAIVAGLVVAMADILLYKPPKDKEKGKK
jgi:hypothetical protein